MDTPLLADQRRAFIRAEVNRLGAVRVTSLTESLGVSEMTVRRDIAALAERGLLARVHGGAVAQRSASEPAFADKAARSSTQKAAIAEAVARLIEPGTSLGITAGTTTAAAAAAIARLPHAASLRILTNSLGALEAFTHLEHRPSITVTGGEPTPSNALVGPLAEATCRDFHLDVLLLGVGGMSPTAGLTSPNTLEVGTLRAFIAAASRVVVLADSDKWGTTALQTITDWAAVDLLVTDDGLPHEARTALSGTEIITVALSVPSAATTATTTTTEGAP